jgi:hypothetical protein
MSATEQGTVDVRVVFYRGEAEIGEIVRVHDRVIKTTIESLGKEFGVQMGDAIGRGDKSTEWKGDQYTWTIEVLTAVRRRRLLLEVYRERAMAIRAGN